MNWIVKYSDNPVKKIKKMDMPIVRWIRNLLIKKLGPLNVYGWKKLATDKSLSFEV